MDTGFYGVSTLEAIQYGIPTIAHISEQAIKQAQGKLDKCQIINSPLSVNGLASVIEEFLTSDMYQKAFNTKVYANNFHSYSTVGSLWNEIYNHVGVQQYTEYEKPEPLQTTGLPKEDYDRIAFMVRTQNPRSVLEIGPGTGTLCWYLKNQGILNDINYSMVDFSNSLNLLCRSLNGVKPDIWDGSKLPYENNQFDLIILTRSFEKDDYFSTIKYLKEVNRVANTVIVKLTDFEQKLHEKYLNLFTSQNIKIINKCSTFDNSTILTLRYK